MPGDMPMAHQKYTQQNVKRGQAEEMAGARGFTANPFRMKDEKKKKTRVAKAPDKKAKDKDKNKKKKNPNISGYAGSYAETGKEKKSRYDRMIEEQGG